MESPIGTWSPTSSHEAELAQARGLSGPAGKLEACPQATSRPAAWLLWPQSARSVSSGRRPSADRGKLATCLSSTDKPSNESPELSAGLQDLSVPP